MAETVNAARTKSAGKSTAAGIEIDKGIKSQSSHASSPMTDASQADPSLNQKAMAIMTAAKELFLEQGFGDVSMDQVARQAGVSKATVYAHFTSKEKLFAEMVFRACIAKSHAVMPPVEPGMDIEATLEEIAHIVVDHLLAPEPLAVYRIIMAEGPRFPELPRAFFGNGPLPMIRKLSDFFADANRLGLLDVPDTRLAAEQMVWMVRGPLGVRRLFTTDVPGDFPAEEDVIKGAAKMFLKTYGPRKSESRRAR